MDFLCFYFPLFCIHWLMGNYIPLSMAWLLIQYILIGEKLVNYI